MSCWRRARLLAIATSKLLVSSFSSGHFTGTAVCCMGLILEENCILNICCSISFPVCKNGRWELSSLFPLQNCGLSGFSENQTCSTLWHSIRWTIWQFIYHVYVISWRIICTEFHKVIVWSSVREVLRSAGIASVMGRFWFLHTCPQGMILFCSINVRRPKCLPNAHISMPKG